MSAIARPRQPIPERSPSTSGSGALALFLHRMDRRPPPQVSRQSALPQHLADQVRAAREVAWDSTARQIDELRIALRERGRRLAAGRILAAADDIFYLTLDEALTPPIDTRLGVKRRKSEREPLRGLTIPDVVDDTRAPCPRPAAPTS